MAGIAESSFARPLQSEITRQANENVRRLLRLLELEPVAGIRNLHPAYCSLLVKFDALRMGHDELEKILRRYLERLEEMKLPEPRRVEIPVCYGGEFGPDLGDMCEMHGMTEAQAIEMHASAEYRVYFLGFVPGFAYLGELPKELVTPRLAAPRKRVPAGSVGIAGNQTGVYPFATPGGWRLIGRTPIKIFRAERDGLSLLSIGDRVRFTPISAERFAELEVDERGRRGKKQIPPLRDGKRRRPSGRNDKSWLVGAGEGMRVIEVQAPGLLTTVQDLGREGFGPLGVSPSGAADAIALRIGNRLVGNVEGAAGLEMTLLGGTFEFPDGAELALSGSDFGATLDGNPVEMGTAFEAKPGQALRVGPTRSGARCYLCVRGGISVEPFLGSASTHLLSGLGGHDGRALRKGDVLTIGVGKGGLPPWLPLGEPRHRRRTVAAKALERLVPRKVLRVTPGPQSDWFPKAAQKIFYASTYRVTEEANRMGLRLEGTALPEGAHGEMISEGISLGAVQIAAGGLPIILFVEQQTTGGYAKIANVISADFHSLGQLRPRDEIRFERVDWKKAQALLVEQEKLLASEESLFESSA